LNDAVNELGAQAGTYASAVSREKYIAPHWHTGVGSIAARIIPASSANRRDCVSGTHRSRTGQHAGKRETFDSSPLRPVDVRLAIEQRPQAVGHRLVVLGQHDPDP
jgi:hypothetical protein